MSTESRSDASLSLQSAILHDWSAADVLIADEQGLEPGRSLNLNEYRWQGAVTPGAVLRWGFRSATELSAQNFRLEFFSASGRSLKVSDPVVHMAEDTDGLISVVLETTAVVGAMQARLSGLAEEPRALMIGPVAQESYTRSLAGPFLGREVLHQLPEGTGSVRLEGLLVSNEASTPLHLALRFLDGEGTELLPSVSTSVSPAIGSYVTLERRTSAGWARALVFLPEGTRAVAVRPLKSRPETAVLSTLRIATRSRAADSLDAFLSELAPDTPIVFIDSTAPPLGSGLITIRPNNMAIQYSSLGYAVVSVGYGDLQGVDRRPAPLIYQAPRTEFGDVIERLSGEAAARRCLYVCSSFPSPTAVAAVDRLKDVGWTTLYEIRDDMEEFKRVGYSQWYSAEGESLICRRADHITAVSPALADKAAVFSLGTRNPVVIPNGIQTRFISKAAPLRSLEAVEAKRLQGIVGYVGHLTDAWFDWDFVLRAAEVLSDNTFEIIGPGKPESLRLPENVLYHGPQPQETLQDFTRTWAVGLVPFKKSPLTRAVDPNKLFEYVAWGMRTIAAEMGSIEDCPTASSYHTFDEMISALRSALSVPWTQHELDRAEAFLRDSTWRRRAEQTLEVVGL